MDATQSFSNLIADNPLYGSHRAPGEEEKLYQSTARNDFFGIISLNPTDPASAPPSSAASLCAASSASSPAVVSLSSPGGGLNGMFSSLSGQQQKLQQSTAAGAASPAAPPPAGAVAGIGSAAMDFFKSSISQFPPRGSMDGSASSTTTSVSKGTFISQTSVFSSGASSYPAASYSSTSSTVYSSSSTQAGEQQGLLTSGFTAFKDTASRLVGSAKQISVVSTAQSLTDSVNTMTSTQNLLLFGLMAAAGVVSMMLAFLTLPLLVFAPSKFALLFTLGSLCFLVSLAMLRGVKALFSHLIEPRRVPFTVAYALSLVLTLYATLFAKSYVLTLVFSVVQLLALASFLVSYIPGGKRMLQFVGSAVWQMLKKMCNCKDARDLSLPL